MRLLNDEISPWRQKSSLGDYCSKYGDWFIEQVADIISNHLNAHFVGLYLSHLQKIVLKSGSGKLGKLLLSHNHQFQRVDNSSVNHVINSGNLYLTSKKYKKPHWYLNVYKSSPPIGIQCEDEMSFISDKEINQKDSGSQSIIHPIPPGWELYLPMRLKEHVFGVTQIHFWNTSEFTEKQISKWWPNINSSGQHKEIVSLENEDVSSLQWMADQISNIISKKATS